MSWFRSKCGVGVLAISLTVGFGAPGCHQVAAFLLRLICEIGVEVAATKAGEFVLNWIDEWSFEKNSPENQGGDVVADSSDGLTGHYNGQMELTVKKDGLQPSTMRVSNPRMVWDPTVSKWKLAPDIRRTVKERTDESFGQQVSY